MQGMATCAAVLSTVVLVAACGANDERQEVRLLAGGGSDAAGAGAEAELPGSLIDLTSDRQGTLWALADSGAIVTIGPTGQVAATEAGSVPAESGELSRIAVAAEERVFVLLAHDSPVSPGTIHEVVDGELVPVFADVVEPEERGVASEDGTPAKDAVVGPVIDIAADGDGHLLFLERTEPRSPDSGYALRRVDADGRLSTLAGGPNVEADGSFGDEDADRMSFPAEDSDAELLPVYPDTVIAGGPGESVYLRTLRSVLKVESGMVRRVLGGGTSGSLPLGGDGGPLSHTMPAVDVDYRAGLVPILAVSGNGRLLAGSHPLEGNRDPETDHWRVVEGPKTAQEIADEAAAGQSTTSPLLYVGLDGQATTASMISGRATWYDDDTIAVAAHSDEGGSIIVLIDIHL